MNMIDTAMGALRATVAKALGLDGTVLGTSRGHLTNAAEGSESIMVAGSPGRRVAGSPGRRVAGSPGRPTCVRIVGPLPASSLPA